MLNSKTSDLTPATTSKDPDELRKGKRKRPLHPTIRFSVNIEKPSSETFSEFNYNKLVLKTLVRAFFAVSFSKKTSGSVFSFIQEIHAQKGAVFRR